MDVHLESLLVTDDQERVSETLQVGLDAVGVELALDHERRAVPEARELLVGGRDRRLLDGRRLREWLSADRGRDPAHELDQAGGPRIDDPRLAEHVELFLRAGNRFLAPCDEELEQLLHRSRTFGLGRLRVGRPATLTLTSSTLSTSWASVSGRRSSANARGQRYGPAKKDSAPWQRPLGTPSFRPTGTATSSIGTAAPSECLATRPPKPWGSPSR